MISYDNNLLDYGHYRVGDQTYINKISAILEAERTHQFPHFVFHDDAYNAHAWNIEPAQSLESLYAERAWEIRHRYDHLVLHFSGGADCTNILETFIKNNIPIEELFLRGPLKFSNKDIADTSAQNMYAELWFNAWPLAQQVKEKHLPNVKITVVDTTDFIVDYYKKNPAWYTLDDGVPFTSFTPGTASRADWDAVHPEFRTLTESGKRVGHIFGIEKPLIHFRDGSWYVNFLDKFLNIFFVPRKNNLDLPMYQEAFYWAPSTAAMIIKQAHVIKNYITAQGIDPVWFTELKGRDKHNFIAKIIYNRTLPMLFNPSKYSGGVIFPWDEFFFKDRNTDHVNNWHQGMQYLAQHIPKKWLHNENIYGDLVGIYSQSYKIS